MPMPVEGGNSMADKDNASKVFLGDRKVFADAFNGLLFNGEKIVEPDKLSELDPNEILNQDDFVGLDKNMERHRDLLKQLTLMDAGGKTFAILGIEAQSYLDYSMPVRLMLYDALRLAQEIRNLKQKKVSGGLPDDRIAPVFTLVAYLSPKPWTAARSIRELLMPMPRELDALVQDYRINLLCPNEMSDDGIRKFRTGLAPLLYMLKHDNDEEQLLRGIATEPMFRQLDRPTLSAIRQLTKYDFNIEDDKEIQDMSTGTLTLSQYVYNKGKAEGIAEGKAEGVIRIMLSMNKKPDEIREQLVLICKMSPKQAKQTLEEFSSGS